MVQTLVMVRIMDEQLSALPFGSPITVLNHLENLVVRVTKLTPDMSPEQCIRLLGELALTGLCLEHIEADCLRRAQETARRFSLIA